MKTTVRELLPGDMTSFLELCESRPELDASGASERVASVEAMAFHNPHTDGKPTYVVGVQGDRVVAHLGRMPTRFAVGGQIEQASYIHDLYVHPEIRDVGASGFFLTMKLYKEAEKISPGFCALIWTNEINISLQKTRKYSQMWTPRYAKILGVEGILGARIPQKSLAEVASRAARGALGGVDQVIKLTRGGGYQVHRVQSFDKRYDALAERLTRSTAIAPVKTAAYLNWKFVDRPGCQCAIFEATDSAGQLAGFTVLRHPEPGRNFGSIIELTAVDRDPKLIGALVDEGVSYFRKLGPERISTLATDPIYAGVLESRLFSARQDKEPLFIGHAGRSTRPDLLQEIKNWHMMFGDSDGPFLTV